ncbi:VOC family protein [Halorutilales archaeon Cl-col2-1]
MELSRLGLEVKYLRRAREFYTNLGLEVDAETDRAVSLNAGGTEVVLRRPSGLPRGGVHTHFALSTPTEEYGSWLSRLLDLGLSVSEYSFGEAKSAYFYDPDGHCVEIGAKDSEGEGITGIFEVVLEVEDLERSEEFYESLGMEVYDRGDARRRVRLDAGGFDLELWEPHLGIADARGGIHVEMGIEVESLDGLEETEEKACWVSEESDSTVLGDPDGHYLRLSEV